jgi:hypothetical protein
MIEIRDKRHDFVVVRIDFSIHQNREKTEEKSGGKFQVVFRPQWMGHVIYLSHLTRLVATSSRLNTDAKQYRLDQRAGSTGKYWYVGYILYNYLYIPGIASSWEQCFWGPM